MPQQPGTEPLNGVDPTAPNSNGPASPVPNPYYYQHIASLADGDYQLALKGFRGDLSIGLRAASSGWVDSICYYTMLGETYYRMGQLSDALDAYNTGLKLNLAFPEWMMGIRLPQSIPAQPAGANIPWGHSTRGAKTSRFPPLLGVNPGTILLDPVASVAGGNGLLWTGNADPGERPRGRPLHGVGDETASGVNGPGVPVPTG